MYYIRHMWNATSELNVESSTLSVVESGKVVFTSKLSNLIDSNVAFHMHLILELSLPHVKCDVWSGPKCP